ncbi:MAG: YceI family protein [Gemmatimonadaceae bacterium]
MELDTRNTRVTFECSLGPLTVRGIFRELSGQLLLPNADIERASVSIDVLAASIDTGLPMRDRHLRGVSFLDSQHTPFVSYRSERVARNNGTLLVEGILSLRGVEREVSTTLPVAWAEQQGVAGTLSLTTALTITRADYAVGVPRGIDILNPIFLAVGPVVVVQIEVVVPATRLLPALLPALGR